MKLKLITLLAVSGILASCSHTPKLTQENLSKGSVVNRVVAQDDASLQKFDFNLQCGDTDQTYVDMDLSEYFKETYLSDEQKIQYEAEGFDYMIAGRNCGLGSWQGEEYSVLFLFEGKKSKEIFDLGPFSVFKAVINLRLTEEKFNKQRTSGKVMITDLVLTGEKNSADKRVLTGENGIIEGSMTSERGSGKVKVIISPK